MAQQPVNTGSKENDGTGDAPRVAYTKLNANDAELYSLVATIQASLGGATYLVKANNLSDLPLPATARANISAAASGNNSDIKQITGLTTPLAAGQGGTGAASLTAALDATFGSAQGSVLYRDSGVWKALGPGASGQYFTAGGIGASPSWSTLPATAGNVSTSGTIVTNTLALWSGSNSVQTASATQARVASGLNSTGAISFRNRIRNGAFTINQRAVSGTVTLAAGAYGHDGFKAGASGCTYTFSTAASGDVTLNITAGTLLQIMEGGLYLPEGGAYTASWTGTAAARAYQGAASGSYVASPLAVTGLTAGTNATIEFGLGTLSLVQFEPGVTASAFERRDDELRRCQRYYAKGTAQIIGQGYTAGAASSIMIRLSSAMMAAPTVTIGNLNSSQMNPPTINVLTAQDILFYATTTTTTAAASSQFNWFAASEL